MFLRPNYRAKDGKDHIYWSLVETVRTVDGPRQRTLCYLGELNGSAQARWLKSVEVQRATHIHLSAYCRVNHHFQRCSPRQATYSVLNSSKIILPTESFQGTSI